MSDLLTLLVPPQHPQEVPPPDGWARVEQILGLPLPPDYKHFLATYGTGNVADFLYPWNPFARNPNLHLFLGALERLTAFRVIRADWGPQECPYPLYPEPGGLLPWGVTDNGDTLCWRTVGPPAAWPVVLSESRGPQFEEFAGSLTEFLTALLARSWFSEILPDDWPPPVPQFAAVVRQPAQTGTWLDALAARSAGTGTADHGTVAWVDLPDPDLPAGHERLTVRRIADEESQLTQGPVLARGWARGDGVILPGPGQPAGRPRGGRDSGNGTLRVVLQAPRLRPPRRLLTLVQELGCDLDQVTAQLGVVTVPTMAPAAWAGLLYVFSNHYAEDQRAWDVGKWPPIPLTDTVLAYPLG